MAISDGGMIKMENLKETGCRYCDFGDIELLRSNGYIEDKYIFCELCGKIIEVIENCPSCATNHIEKKRQANIDFLTERMLAKLEGRE